MTIHGEAQDGTLTRASLQKYQVLVGVDDQDSNGFTPLALAVKNGHSSVVKLLLQSGASASKPVRDGRTPLYLAANAKQNRARIVELLLAQSPKPDIDAASPDWNNETPLIVAITQGRDPEVVKLLVEGGASLTKANDRGETPVALADQSTNPALKNSLAPKGQQGGYGSALAQLLVSAVLFALAYADKWPGVKDIIQNVIRSAYNQANPTPPGAKPPVGTDIDDPQTVDDFKHNIGNVIQDSGLEDFFPPNDPFVQQVAEKAAALRKGSTATPYTVPQIMKQARIALYQPVIYFDDSGSMDNDNRMKNARELVTKITEVATELSPETYGAHLRFINKDDSTANNLNAKQVDQRLQFTPAGSTELGTNLEKKVLQPLVYDVINQGVLHRPLVILTITDGIPTDGQDTFAQVLKRCIKTLEGKGYDKRAVYFDLSQVGNDQEAIAFIESLESETATRGPLHDTLHRTAQSQYEFFDELRDNDAKLKDWLRDLLMKAIQYKN